MIELLIGMIDGGIVANNNKERDADENIIFEASFGDRCK